MSAYVDQLSRSFGPKWKWPRACHLFADTLDELHDIAQRIGLRREWFQDRRDFPHYDINATKRAMAVKLGAIEATTKFVVDTLRNNRQRREMQ